MTYLIAFVIIVVAAGALLLFRQPAEMPSTSTTDPELEVVSEIETTNIPEGFTPPTTPPPQNDLDVEVESEATISELPATESAATQTYSAPASYFTPNRTEHQMLITLELQGETIVDANVTYDGSAAATPNHTNFDNAYPSLVIGQNINDVRLSRVGGASLTSTAFNDAIEDIKGQL